MLKNKAFTERTTFLEENFLSTGSFFQTLGKFYQKRFAKRKGLPNKDFLLAQAKFSFVKRKSVLRCVGCLMKQQQK